MVVMGWSLITSLAVLTFLLASPLPEPWKFPMILLHFAGFGQWLMILLLLVSSGMITVEFVVGLISALIAVVIGSVTVMTICAGILFILMISTTWELFAKILLWAPPKFGWGIISVAYYFFIVAILWVVLTTFLELSISNYTGVQI
jgi:hypothetical protein